MANISKWNWVKSAYNWAWKATPEIARVQLPYATDISLYLDIFLHHETQKTLLLKGKWGVGKTFFWNEYIKTRLRDVGPIRESKYAYVSLFGLNSIEEVEHLIFAQSTLVGPQKTFISKRYKLRRLYPFMDNIPWLKEIAGPLKRLGTLLLKNTLICFDDLERLGASLPLDQLFGLISTLKEQNNCRVVILANEDAIDGEAKEIFNRYHEKIIDKTVPFSPPPAECAQVVFGACPDIECLTRLLVRLPLANIRIIRQASWIMEYFKPYLEGRLEETVRIVRDHILLLTAFIRDKENHIDVEKLSKWSPIAMYLGEKKDDKEYTEQSKRLMELDYEHTGVDRFIIDMLRDGVCDRDALKVELDEMDDHFKHREMLSRQHEMWALFNGNFKAEPEQILAGFCEFLDQYSGQLSAHDLQQCLSLVEKIGGTVKAGWKDAYVLQNLPNADLNKVAELEQQASDPTTIEAIKERRNLLQREMSIYGTIKAVVDRQGWNPDMVEYLVQQPVDAYKQEIMSEADQSLLHNLYAFGRMWKSSGEKEQKVVQKMADALDMIASTSEVNRLRVQWILGEIRPATASPEDKVNGAVS